MEENETENVDKKLEENLIKKKPAEDKVKFEVSKYTYETLCWQDVNCRNFRM